MPSPRGKLGRELATPTNKERVQIARSDEETAELRALVKAGRLFEVQEWISAGHPVCLPGSKKRHALEIAVEQGFHSMVEILAAAWPDTVSLNHALHTAVENKRADLVFLLMKHGADLKYSPLSSVAMTGSKELMRHVLDNWEEFGDSRALVLIVTAMPRSLVGLVRQYARRIPDYVRQLSESLLYFIDDDSPKWIALSLWMGADPFFPVRTPGLGPDEPDERLSPIEYAVFKGKRDAFDQLRPKTGAFNYTGLLSHVCIWRREGIALAEYLVELGADVNNKPNGGSSVLDRLLQPTWDFQCLEPAETFSWSEVGHVERWVEFGARFVPDNDWAISDARRGLRIAEASHIERVMGALRKASNSEDLFRLFNESKLLKKLLITSEELRQRVKTLPSVKPKKDGKGQLVPANPIVFVSPEAVSFKQLKPHIVQRTRNTYDRKELYEAIWSTPASTLAKKLGLSDVGLAKICKRFDIPRPGRGYWAKHAVGMKQPQPQLKHPEQNPRIAISSYRSATGISDEALRKRVEETLRELTASLVTVDVLSDEAPLHPCMESWQHARPNSEAVDLRLRRVINTLLQLLDRLGWSPKEEQRESNVFYCVCVLDRKVDFEILRERAVVTVTLHGAPFGCKSKWQDGKRHFVESRFLEIASWFAYSAALRV